MGQPRKIGVIGLGTIAAAVVEGIASDGHDIVVSPRGRANATRLSGQFANVTVAENQAVVDASDIVFLGLTDAVAAETLEPLHFRSEQQVIALMGDLDFQAVARLVAPATMAARMIPFPAIAGEGSPILVCGDCSLIHGLFGVRHHVFELESEVELKTYLCAQAVLSPVALMLTATTDWLAQQGLDRISGDKFLRMLVASGLEADDCQTMLAALATPGGFNMRLGQSVERAGLVEALVEGLNDLKFVDDSEWDIS